MDRLRSGAAPRFRRVERGRGDPLAAARPRRGGGVGFSLVEVMVAILLTAIIVISVFSVAVTAQRSSVIYDRKVIANYAATQLLERLRNYVTADLAGPGANRGPRGPGAASWSMYDVCGAGCGDSCGSCLPVNCYALDPCGLHNVTTMLPANLTAAPYNMTMTYTVTDYPTGCAVKDCKYRVNVIINWGELQ